MQDKKKPKLSPREHEVATLVADGCQNKRIAALLNLTVPTVGSYLDRIYRKTNVSNRAELTQWCFRNGVFTTNEST